MASVRVGLFPAGRSADGDPEQLRATLARVADAGVDHLCVGDHVSFFVGAGSDGLITRDLPARRSGRAAGVRRALPAAVAPPGSGRPPARDDRGSSRPAGSRSASGSAARTATRSRSAASTRRRVDAGWTSAFRSCAAWPTARRSRFDGEFFSLDDALILPAPSPPIPLIVGGRSDAAVSRAATARRRLARDLGLAAPVRRGARSDRPAGHARSAGTRAGSSTRSTSGAASRATREAAREPLATQMQDFYQMPFEPFERYSPYGTAERWWQEAASTVKTPTRVGRWAPGYR